MRLLWVQNHFWPEMRGGAETRAYFTVRALRALGHEVDVLCRRSPSGETVGHDVLDGARIHRVFRPEIGSHFWRIQPWLRMRQWKGICREFLKDRHYEGVISLQPETVGFIRQTARNVPVILAMCGTLLGARGYDFSESGSSLNVRFAAMMRFRQYLYYERKACKAADRIIAESRNVEEQLVRLYRVPAEKVSVVKSGVDTALFCPRPEVRDVIRRRENWPAEAFIVIGVGRLDRVKNFEYFVRSVAVASREANIVGVLVGHGSQREYLGTLAKDLGVSDRVIFAGHRSDVHELLSASDAFLLPSVYEAYGAAWPEALACGLPCLGLRREFGRINTASDEHIIDGETGYLVSADDPRDCARRLVDLAKNPERRNQMSKAARDSAVANYDWNRTAERYVELLRA